MPFRLLPVSCANECLSERHLHLINLFADTICHNDGRKTLSMEFLSQFLRDHFVDGCSTTTLFENPIEAKEASLAIHTTRPKTIVDFIKSSLSEGSINNRQEWLVYDCSSAVSYMIIRLNGLESREQNGLVLWQHAHIFDESDLATMQILIKILKFCTVNQRYEHCPIIQENGHVFNDDHMVCGSSGVLQKAIDAVPDLILFCDYDGSILSMNSAASECLSKVLSINNNESKGHNWMANACHPDDVKDLFNTWTEASHARAPRKLRCRVMVDPCRYRQLLCRFVPVSTRLNKTTEHDLHWIVVGTSLKNEEDEDDISQMKNLFIAEISHEIRTPLACIIGTSTLLAHTALNEEQSELVRTITISSQQLSSLINNVIDMNRIAEDKLVVEKSPVHLDPLICETLELFRSDCIQKKLDMAVELSPLVPWEIFSDELRIRQVLTNLVSNSIKFTRPGTVITVKSQVIGLVNGKRGIRVSVADQGIGISESDGSRLFGVFRQLQSNTDRKHGAGLGLAICKKLVQLLGGSIGYSSVLGQGSIFYFDLPWEFVSQGLSRVETLTRADCSDADPWELLKNIIDTCTKKIYRVGIKMVHIELSECIINLLEKCPYLVPSIIDNELEEECDILITDIQKYVNTQLSREGGVIFLSHDPSPTSTDLNAPLEHLRKPYQPRLLIMELCQLLQKINKQPSLSYNNKEAEFKEATFAKKYPLHLLVAEDDELNRKLLERVLVKFGYKQIPMADNGKDAYDKAVQLNAHPGEQLDVIFMDMQMPILDGCGAATLLRTSNVKCHIIAMTANAFEEDRNACLQAGMCDYASKPVKWDTLKSLLIKSYEIKIGKTVCTCNKKL